MVQAAAVAVTQVAQAEPMPATVAQTQQTEQRAQPTLAVVVVVAETRQATVQMAEVVL
jgi:hypothetical protein